MAKIKSICPVCSPELLKRYGENVVDYMSEMELISSEEIGEDGTVESIIKCPSGHKFKEKEVKVTFLTIINEQGWFQADRSDR